MGIPIPTDDALKTLLGIKEYVFNYYGEEDSWYIDCLNVITHAGNNITLSKSVKPIGNGFHVYAIKYKSEEDVVKAGLEWIEAYKEIQKARLAQ